MAENSSGTIDIKPSAEASDRVKVYFNSQLDTFIIEQGDTVIELDFVQLNHINEVFGSVRRTTPSCQWRKDLG